MALDQQPRRILMRLLFSMACLTIGIGAGLVVRSLRADPYAAARSEFAGLSPAEQREILRNYKLFTRLSAAEQQQLREFQQQLAAASDAESLSVILENYERWVKNLTPTQRAELTLLAGDNSQRISRVEEYQREQLRRAPLTADDIQRLVTWLDEIVRKNVDGEGRSILEHSEDVNERKRRLLWFALQRLQDRGSSRTINLSEADFQVLSEQLSPQARQRLADAKSLTEKRREIVGWIYLTMRKLHSESRSWQLEEVSEQELVQFFESKLDDARREELLALTPLERTERLRIFYLRDKYPDRPFGPPSFSRPPGGRTDASRFEPPRIDGSRTGSPANERPRFGPPRNEGPFGEGPRNGNPRDEIPNDSSTPDGGPQSDTPPGEPPARP